MKEIEKLSNEIKRKKRLSDEKKTKEKKKKNKKKEKCLAEKEKWKNTNRKFHLKIETTWNVNNDSNVVCAAILLQCLKCNKWIFQ